MSRDNESRASTLDFDLGRFETHYARIQRHAAECSQAKGYAPPRVVIVTKYLESELTDELLAAGHGPLGENRAQQIVAKNPGSLEPARWHFIGHLQRNKLAAVLPRVSLVHSLDSRRLAAAAQTILAKQTDAAESEKLCDRFLVQVNTSGESSKGGLTPEEALREIPAWRQDFPLVRLEGLMTMAPISSPDERRACFRRLRETRDQIRLELASPAALPELSMGMSGDYEEACEEGATLVRIGRVLYEG